MKRSIATVLGSAVAISLALAGCSSNSDNSTGPTAAAFPTGDITLTLSGWSLSSTPEFQTLADGFHAAHPNVTVNVKEYDANTYDTLMQADLTAGTATDVITIKNFQQYYAYEDEGAFADISDVAGNLPASNGSVGLYAVDGKTYGIPYRQDSWVIYYNKALFDKAGVAYPDGTWTWDDYVANADKLETGLKAAGSSAYAAYQHSWQSTVQGLALAQTPGASLQSGDYSYLKPYYTRDLQLQNDGDQHPLADVTSAGLHYQSEFGKQNAAMEIMGTWYVSTILAERKTGAEDTFDWGIAPAPQVDSSTTLPSGTPVTFGDPTGLAVNGSLSGDQLTVAKAFVAWAGDKEAALALTKLGLTTAYQDSDVVNTFFSTAGLPTDDLSKTSLSKHTVKPENPVGPHVADIKNLLNSLHTDVLTGTSSFDDALAKYTAQIKSTVLNS